MGIRTTLTVRFKFCGKSHQKWALLVICGKTYLVTKFVAHEVLEGTHSVVYREVAVRLEQSFVSLTVAQEQEHALG
jgi:hypothetical protein